MNVASNDAVLLLPASTNSAVTSPTAPDSPATPVSNLETDTVKIAHGSDYSEVPILPLVEPVKVEVASHMPEVGTPVDPGKHTRVYERVEHVFLPIVFCT
jgi:hypothetical protein